MTQKLRDDYDWVVLGDSPGALLSGVLASRLGLSTLIAPFLSVPSVVVSKEGHFLDLESGFVPALLSHDSKGGALLGQSLEKVGAMEELLPHLIVEEDLFSVMSPQGRFRVLRGEGDLPVSEMGELGIDSLLPKADHGFKYLKKSQLQYWEGLPDRLTWKMERMIDAKTSATKVKIEKPKLLGRTAQKKLIARQINSTSLKNHPVFADRFAKAYSNRAGWEAVWAGLGEYLPDLGTHDGFALLEGLALGSQGVDFKGGLAHLRMALKNCARRFGAHVLETGECRRIFAESGRLTGVQIAGKGKVILASGAIVGCSISQASEHIVQDGRSWFRWLKSAPSPQGWKFTLALVVQPETIPVSMSRRLIWKEEGAPVLEVEIRHPEEFGVTSSHRYIYLRTVLPWDPNTLTTTHQRDLAARMYQKACEFFPFLEFNTARIFPDFRVLGSELAELYGFSTLEAIPEFLRVYGPQPGVGNGTGVEGLFLASQESYPDLGLFGSVVSGIEATSWIAHKKGLSGPFA